LENYIVKLDFDRSRGTNTIRLYMWAKPELESMMQKNRVSGYMFSNNPVLDRYLKSIVFGHNLDSISKCAKRDFAVKKYYLFNGEIWPDGNYDFRAKYAREKYGLRFFVTSDIRHEGEEAYQNTMAKLLMDIKMPGPGKIKREADSLYYKTHKRED
jgi:hypothetical protein